MPLIPFLAALLVVFLFVLSTPFLLVLRYRIGTARRPARRWIATLNLVSLLFSAALFLWIAALTNFWVPHAFRYSLIGFIVGVLLGLLGLKLTRWEQTARGLYYQPNRWLVLLITLAVAARLLYGFWRIWHAWQTIGPDASWLASAGIPGSMGVGALVLSYYLTYFAGVRWRLSSSQASPGRLTKLAKILLLGCCLMASACTFKEDFPTEDQMKARLHVDMTVDEVLAIFLIGTGTRRL